VKSSNGTILYRDARNSDAESVATLHAESWKRHYRGVLLDSFLNNEVLADRLAVWRQRLSNSRHDAFTIIAEQQALVVGFVHVILDDDPAWGALLENLHISFELKRKGIGRALMIQAAARLLQRGRQKFYLWVFDQNITAQRFYAALGGITSESCVRGPLPGGSYALAHRIAWTDASMVIGGRRG